MKKLRCRRCGKEIAYEHRSNRLGDLYWYEVIFELEEPLNMDYLCLPNLWITDDDPASKALFHDPLPRMTDTEWRQYIWAQLDLVMS